MTAYGGLLPVATMLEAAIPATHRRAWAAFRAAHTTARKLAVAATDNGRRRRNWPPASRA